MLEILKLEILKYFLTTTSSLRWASTAEINAAYGHRLNESPYGYYG